MNTLNIQIYTLIIIFVLILNYYINHKEEKEANTIFFSIASSLSLMAILNIIATSYNLNSNTKIILSIINYILAMVPSIGFYLYVITNLFNLKNITNIIKKVIYPYLLYIVFIIFYFLLFNKDFEIGNTLFISGQNSNILLLCIIPYLYLFIEIKKTRRNIFISKSLFFDILIPIIGIFTTIIWNNYIIFVPAQTISLLLLHMYKINFTLYIDPLTKIYNRRFLTAENNIKLLKRGNIYMYYIDIDYFKKINDKYGHNAGDKILKDTAKILKSSIRKTDYPVRMGGDEFLLITELKDKNDAHIIKDRIKDKINQYNKNNKINISLSIGYDIYKSNENFDEFINKIDQKMYDEKNKKQ